MSRKFEIETKQDESMYLKMSAASGKYGDDEVEFELCTTFGIGGLTLILTMDDRPKESIDLRPLLKEWVQAMYEDKPT